MKKNGFSLIELVVTIFIIGTLATIVTINFRTLRTSQEIQAAADDFRSQIREVQNYVLVGQEGPTGQPANSYEVVLASGQSAVQVRYCLLEGGAENCQPLKQINLSQNAAIDSIRRDGSNRISATIKFTSPFGKTLVDGTANRVVEIDLVHTKDSSFIKTVVIDGISGRINLK